MNCANIASLRFSLWQDTPLITAPRFTPLLADPTVLTPDESPDGLWHLMAHSVYGILHHTSTDGIHWKRKRKSLVRAALRPYIFREGDNYYLFYEKYRGFQLLFSFLPGQRWYSRLEMIQSKDLVTWSEPAVVLTPDLPYQQDAKLGKAVSNPCLIRTANGFRLYFSASLVRVPDCGFNEPLHISYAESIHINGPYHPVTHPVWSPDPGQPWNNLGAGSMKVVRCEDGYIAFQNGIYEHEGKSGSAICLLHSQDGIRWAYAHSEPLLQPNPALAWMASHIYACDIKFFQNKAYLYFNARNHAHWSKGSEHIGLAVADLS